MTSQESNGDIIMGNGKTSYQKSKKKKKKQLIAATAGDDVSSSTRLLARPDELIDKRFDTSTKPQFRFGGGGGGGGYGYGDSKHDKNNSNSIKNSSSNNNNNNNSNKMVLDDRFKAVLTDSRFQLQIKDKYGRQNHDGGDHHHRRRGKSSSPTSTRHNGGGGGGGEELSEFYTIDQSDNPKGVSRNNPTFVKDPHHHHHQSKESKFDTSNNKANSESESDHGSLGSCDDDENKGGRGEIDNNNNSNSNNSKEERDLDPLRKKDHADTDPASRIAYLTALSRGEIDVSSSSEEEDDDDDDNEDGTDGFPVEDDDDDDDHDDGVSIDTEDPVMGRAGVLDPSFQQQQQHQQQQQQSTNDKNKMERTLELSRYLAVLNMDWSFVRAVDILALMNSFCPTGTVQSVRVFPSDFGIERMSLEQQQGPQGLWKKPNPSKTHQQQQQQEDPSADDLIEGGHSESNERHEDKTTSNDDEEEEPSQDIHHDEENVPNQYERSGFTKSEGTDFDPEKLRAYEVSKLKYYFAIVEFTETQYADIAYQEIDGIELEHSSAAVDLRTIPEHELDGVIINRVVRDEARHVPSNYVPPDFVVNALQQTKVECTWELGDRGRERNLTSYYSATSQNWNALAEADDLMTYLASDGSSDEEDNNNNNNNNDDGVEGGNEAEDRAAEKALNKRKLLGLESDSDNDDGGGGGGAAAAAGEAERREPFQLQMDDTSSSSSEGGGELDRSDKGLGDKTAVVETFSKQVQFIPGQSHLREKIVSKLQSADHGGGGGDEQSPWEKYQEKRKQKRKERRQAARLKRHEVNQLRKSSDQQQHEQRRNGSARDGTDPAVEEADNDNDDDDDDQPVRTASKPLSQSELELLVVGDNQDADEDEKRNYDMRGLQRLEKLKDKKLRGSRKRKETALTAEVTGSNFAVNVSDERFRAVLDGVDDRFGIDRTDPQFKETAAMRAVLAEQSRRRQAKRAKNSHHVLASTGTNTIDKASIKSNQASQNLASLVDRVKTKIGK